MIYDLLVPHARVLIVVDRVNKARSLLGGLELNATSLVKLSPISMKAEFLNSSLLKIAIVDGLINVDRLAGIAMTNVVYEDSYDEMIAEYLRARVRSSDGKFKGAMSCTPMRYGDILDSINRHDMEDQVRHE